MDPGCTGVFGGSWQTCHDLNAMKTTRDPNHLVEFGAAILGDPHIFLVSLVPMIVYQHIFLEVMEDTPFSFAPIKRSIGF